jgi:hypothetical protein
MKENLTHSSINLDENNTGIEKKLDDVDQLLCLFIFELHTLRAIIGLYMMMLMKEVFFSSHNIIYIENPLGTHEGMLLTNVTNSLLKFFLFSVILPCATGFFCFVHNIIMCVFRKKK